MLVYRCWWLNNDVGNILSMLVPKHFIVRQHISSPTSVINIEPFGSQQNLFDLDFRKNINFPKSDITFRIGFESKLLNSHKTFSPGRFSVTSPQNNFYLWPWMRKCDTCDECDFYYSENEIRMLKHDSIYKGVQKSTDHGSRLSERLFILIWHCTFCQHFGLVVIKTVF